MIQSFIKIGAVAGLALLSLGAAQPAQAETKIVEVVSPGGVKAWLVEEQSIPIISIAVNFSGGENLISDDKAGASGIVSLMMEEGAGPYDAAAFNRRTEELAARLSFGGGSDSFTANATMLLQNRDETIELFRTALQEPRFADDALARVKKQVVSTIRSDQTDPNYLASQKFFELRFPNDVYSRPTKGSEKTVNALTTDDLRTAHKALMRRDNIIIGVVGAITPEELAPILDTLFLPLPESGPAIPAAAKPVEKSGVEIVEFDAPQSTVFFGHRGILRDDPDFITAFVMNQVLGGGSFTSRLYKEVREKRGLAYGVYSYLYPLDRTGLYAGGVATANNRIAETIEVIRAEWARMAAGDISEEELDRAKRYLIGSFALRFDSNAKIAGFLIAMQRNELGAEYLTERNKLIAAVTLDDVKRVAKRLLDADALHFVVVGKPEGL